ncbi:MAG: YjgN family protein, partial [Spirochaetota bacterium]|nr:YjgN family protein [Spirochaetota bacterium]
MARSKNFVFDGGAATYFGTGILAALITLFTIGIGLPWALCLLERWKAKHTFILGRRLHFSGSGMGLIGLWIKWYVL